MALRRALGLFETTMLGVGIIVGAGIYVLVGIAGVEAGPALWLSFVVAGLIAVLTGLSYAELSSMYPRAGSSYYYAKHAFGSKKISFMLGWLIAVAAIIAAAAVALGFGQYLNSMFSGTYLWGALGLLVFLGAVNAFGIKQASGLNILCTLLEVAGLLFVAALAFAFATPTLSWFSPHGFTGIISGAAIAFFAYLGFEVLATSAEEVKDARRLVPKAILLSILVCMVLYVLAALAFTALMSYDDIVASTQGNIGPLAFAASKVGGDNALRILAAIALFSTANTVLLCMLAASRMLYGMARDHALPRFFVKTARSGAPLNAVLVVTVLAAAVALTGNLALVARAAVASMFVVFAVDNFSVIRLRFKEPDAQREFKTPLSIARVPVLALIALLSCVAIMLHEFAANPVLLVAVSGIVLAGFAFYAAEEHFMPLGG